MKCNVHGGTYVPDRLSGRCRVCMGNSGELRPPAERVKASAEAARRRRAVEEHQARMADREAW